MDHVAERTELHMLALGLFRLGLVATVDGVAQLLDVDAGVAAELVEDLAPAGLLAARPEQ